MLPVSISRRIYTAALTVIMIVSAAFPLPCAEESSNPARNEAVRLRKHRQNNEICNQT